MYFIVILLALAALQLWGSRNPLHRDTAFGGWIGLVEEGIGAQRLPSLQAVVVLLIPVVLVAVLTAVLPFGFWLVLATVVLLYSLGRGDFAPETMAYTLACNDGAWDVAVSKAKKHNARVDDLAVGDWPELHLRMLEAGAYQGFERLFAVLFWFLIFGPAGALLYRLSFLYARMRPEREILQRWLWALEWLPVRLVGASFAITGNFVGCVNRWKTYALDVSCPSATVLGETVLGALSVDDELMQSCDCSQREVLSLKRLYTRTLWFWVTCLAIWILLQS